MKELYAVDIGSVYIAIAKLENNEIKKIQYKPHKGDFLSILNSFGLNINDIYLTGVNSLNYGGFHPFFVLSRYARIFGNVKHVVYVGGSSYFIINLDEEGNYLGHEVNTTCASGTGSFLDLQAKRLGYSIEEMGEKALKAKIKPAISTRCSVFAKTDLIHLQQEGYTKEEISAGLCYSMAQNVIQALFKGKRPEGKILLTGGVFKNKTFLKAFRDEFNDLETICEEPEWALAFGLLSLVKDGSIKKDKSVRMNALLGEEKFILKNPPLEVKSENYPDFSKFETTYDEIGNEIIFYNTLPQHTDLKVYMGIDIGSTSTKVCLIDEKAKPIVAIYRKTSSDPIGAVKRIFEALSEMEKINKLKFVFLGTATTGSGRNLIGKVIGADFIINEISAHAKAATFIDPEVDTIFEIGGQDSKFTQLKNGIVYYSVMNYVCAAGTGSFIEEQAEKLGIPIDKFAELAEGSPSPPISDRCTVFMEKDIDLLIAKGVPKNEIASAVLHSVRDNYLNKVVGNITIGDKIYFQGATARNRALIASFEQRLGKKIIVSPYCHITGAMGCAIYLWENKVKSSNFIGLSFCNKNTDIDKEICDLCKNNCSLSLIKTENDVVAWGMKCGRDYEDKKPKKRGINGFISFRDSLLKLEKDNYKEAVYVPDIIGNSIKIDFIKNLLENLKIKPIIIKPDRNAYNVGRQYSYYEICAPCVISYGTISNLKDKPIFMPYFLRNELNCNVSQCHLCPYVQSSPSILKSLFNGKNLISPKILESDNLENMAEEIKRSFKGVLDIEKYEVIEAIKQAKDKVRKNMDEKIKRGKEFFEKIQDNQIYVLVLGRPYVLYNNKLNHNFIDTIEYYGIKAIPVDFLPLDRDFVAKKFPHIYWNYGQVILSSLKYIEKYKNVFPVYLSCFSCGPDSFLLNYFFREMQNLRKPFLSLQLDGHSSATGYITRIESAIESFKNYMKLKEKGKLSEIIYKESSSEIEGNKIYVPPMDVKGAQLFASAFKRYGIDSEVLQENQESFNEGLKYSIGHECSPFHSTLGAIVYRLKKGNGKERVSYFMPSGNGPCRFGQYGLLQNIILKELGFDVSIVSPSGENAYGGLPVKFQKILFDAVLINDILRKVVLKIRPYEKEKGEVDNIYEDVIRNIKKDIENGNNYEKSFIKGFESLANVKTLKEKKPKIAIVGEIYVRNNEFLNDNLIRTIELLGGEAMISSILEWFFYTQEIEKNELKYKSGIDKLKNKLKIQMKGSYYKKREHHFYSMAKDYFRDIFEPPIEEVIESGKRYLPFEFYGEAILTIGRGILFFEKEGASALVNASPTFCMPGTITSYLFKEISKVYNKPIISLFYDKTGNPNLELVPYMEILRGQS
ncbi:MAG: acyl-CoA dehydratase activase [Proteobacteria bacterium]|nr:acyl-CoA dehydratase activase [Pseudomonadota bacterium]